jgi:hypothetical protein
VNHQKSTQLESITANDSWYYQAGAAYVARGLEAEALRTDDPAAMLDACADTLPDVMPVVFASLNMNMGLVPELEPLVGEWLRFAARLHQARATADEAYAEILDIMLDAIRQGASPAAVGARVLELLQQVRAGGEGR